MFDRQNCVYAFEYGINPCCFILNVQWLELQCFFFFFHLVFFFVIQELAYVVGNPPLYVC